MRKLIVWLIFSIFLASCSTTSGLQEGEKLFIGLKEITYNTDTLADDQQSALVVSHQEETQTEVDAALQTAPNGSFFGSSYYRTPFPYGLWIWNACHESSGVIKKWLNKSFGTQPVLINNVNPTLRSQVAENVLKNNGYFNGKVTYDIVDTKNPKKQKISYHVDMGKPRLIDSLAYSNFPPEAEALILQNAYSSKIGHGTPFSTATLDAERSRVSRILRNSGFYYYQNSYASYLADTLKRDGWIDLRLQMADSIPEVATHKWYIGRLTLDIKKNYSEALTDSTTRRYLTIRHSGKSSPVRPRVILSSARMFPRRAYSYQQHNDALTNLANLGLFSMVDFKFTPRDRDTLDLNMLCIMDKPYDFYVQTAYNHKLSGRSGPELKVGLTKKNAFLGGERFDISMHTSYEWQQGHGITDSQRNSYEVGADASVEWPRLLVPFLKRRRYAVSPATKATASFNIINRPSYYRMHTASGDWCYIWSPSDRITHQFSPLTLTYQKLNYSTEKFDSILASNSYLRIAMQDMFIPKMQYTLTYSSDHRSSCPVQWSTTVTEAGNLISAYNKVFFNEDFSMLGKTMFRNAYAQFLKIETNFRKTWKLDSRTQLVAHANAGAIWSFGNMRQAPYTEQFYIGGANSVRAFSARGIGPGGYTTSNRNMSYIDQTGDIILLLNLEYRKRLFGSLFGAAFLDAGNVWAMHKDDRTDSQLVLRNMLKQTALGTGIGLRYDLDFLIIRVDWGVGLHAPYETGKSGFYNFTQFKDSHTLHFAVGYPF